MVFLICLLFVCNKVNPNAWRITEIFIIGVILALYTNAQSIVNYELYSTEKHEISA